MVYGKALSAAIVLKILEETLVILAEKKFQILIEANFANKGDFLRNCTLILSLSQLMGISWN